MASRKECAATFSEGRTRSGLRQRIALQCEVGRFNTRAKTCDRNYARAHARETSVRSSNREVLVRTFYALLIVTFLVALAASFVTVRAFGRPIASIRRRVVA